MPKLDLTRGSETNDEEPRLAANERLSFMCWSLVLKLLLPVTLGDCLSLPELPHNSIFKNGGPSPPVGGKKLQESLRNGMATHQKTGASCRI